MLANQSFARLISGNPDGSEELLIDARRDRVRRRRAGSRAGNIEIRSGNIGRALQLRRPAADGICPKNFNLIVRPDYCYWRCGLVEFHYLDVINVNGSVGAITKLRSNIGAALSC